jgi:zinc protease
MKQPNTLTWPATLILVFTFSLAITGSIRAEDPIPARPEALSFPPLEYEPPEPREHRVQLRSGPVAYLVPSSELPLVDVAIYFRAGNYLVPVGQEGLAELTGYLVTRGGSQKRPADDLEEELDFLAAQLVSAMAETHGTITLNVLSRHLDDGFAILREVLVEPRFQEDKLSLRKEQLLQAMRQRNDDPAEIEARERRFLGYGETFWLNRLPTAASINAISRADLQEFHRRWIHPGNFVVAVSGDFERTNMIHRLETLFGSWPSQGEKTPPVPTDAVFAQPGLYIVNKEVNQGRVSVLLPGIQRDHPDFHAVTVMNDILGGGGFTSRIMGRVRSDEGLAYAAMSHYPGGIYFPSVFTAMFQSKSRTVAYAASIVLDEMNRIRTELVSEEELETARRSFIDPFPRHFSTPRSTANLFAQDELTGRFQRDPDYWKKYRSRIESVSSEDVLRAAKKHLPTDQLVLLVVGQKNEILLGHPNHPVDAGALAGGRIVDLPLRDPLTLRPLRTQ